MDTLEGVLEKESFLELRFLVTVSIPVTVSLWVPKLIAELPAGEAELPPLKIVGSIRISYIKIRVLEHFCVSHQKRH